MAVIYPVPSTRGRLYYKLQTDADNEWKGRFPTIFKQRTPRFSSVTAIEIPVPCTQDPFSRPKRPHWPQLVGKLAGPRESAFRFLSSIVSTPKEDSVQPIPKSRKASRQSQQSEDEDRQDRQDSMPAVDFLRGGPVNSQLQRPSLSAETASINSVQSRLSNRNGRAASVTDNDEAKALAAGNGVSVSVNLAEPVLFVQGFDHSDTSNRNTAMLRGSLHLKVAKSAKIKAVSLTFKGVATTKWPEGIPPKKTEFEERNSLITHCWTFFNAQFPTAEGGTGADVVRLAQPEGKHGSPYMTGSPMGSNINLGLRESKRLSLQVNHARSFEKDERTKHGPTVAQKGYRTFHPGDYIYNFELPIDSRLPESIDVDLGNVKYELEASIERAGAFRANLLGSKEVTLIRALAEGSLEQVEPIAISRNWEDQLHYDIIISGKSFPLGSKVPIAFKLTPLAKVQCHRIKVFVTENTEYFCSGKRVHRVEPTRKVLLFEKRADSPGVSKFPGSSMRITSGGGVPYDQREAAARGDDVETADNTNLLGSLDGQSNIGPTEMEFNVQLPGCQQNTEKDRPNRLHFDTTHPNIQVHHWIKIVMRLSKLDDSEPRKRRHFEISIDSPFHILSCHASQANTALPAYSSPENADPDTTLLDCGCPGAQARRLSRSTVPTLNALNEGRQGFVSEGSSYGLSTSPSYSNLSDGSSDDVVPPTLQRPRPAHVHTNTPALQRPIHMLRAPSFNPPAFDHEEPPPPLVTPPPQYNDIASPSSGLTDYFSRLADAYDDDDTDGEADRSSIRGRVNVPLSPGSRVSRSMELRRERWEAGIVGSLHP